MFARTVAARTSGTVGSVIYRFRTELWRDPGDAGWHFVTLPFDEADEIDEITRGSQRGFGSVRVRVTIGSSTWNTSLFPDSKSASYVLPVKKPVRTAEQIRAGDQVDVSIELVDVAST